MDIVDQTPYFEHPFTAILAGPSQSGKSTLVYQMITNLSKCVNFVPSRIYIAYSRMQCLYDDIKRDSKVPVILIESLSKDFRPPKNSLLIIDDLMGKADSDVITDWFVKNSHHYEVSVLYLMQNLFLKLPNHRTTSLNANFIILFSNPRDKTQIMHLARQISPSNTKFVMDAYRQATSKPHGYIVFNFKQNCPENLRLRDSVFGGASVFYNTNTAVHTDLNSLDGAVV